MMQKELCNVCKHYITALRCEAFPAGIPDDILVGTNNHTKPFKGDKGIRFERMKDQSEGALARLSELDVELE